MEQAQPGELINSHGPSGGGHSQLSMSQLHGSQYVQPRSREPSEPKYHVPQDASLQNASKQHAGHSKAGTSNSLYDPSSRTDYKEGGSVEVHSLKQKYLNELQGSHNFSGQIPHGTSIEVEDRIIRASRSLDEESSPEISVTEQTQQSMQRSKPMEHSGPTAE